MGCFYGFEGGVAEICEIAALVDVGRVKAVESF